MFQEARRYLPLLPTLVERGSQLPKHIHFEVPNTTFFALAGTTLNLLNATREILAARFAERRGHRLHTLGWRRARRCLRRQAAVSVATSQRSVAPSNVAPHRCTL